MIYVDDTVDYDEPLEGDMVFYFVFNKALF